jgi:hypothetical protein
MHIILPPSKTYKPGPMQCIYCLKYKGESDKLHREHIVPRKLGGTWILHNASCEDCAAIINKQIETPMLTGFLKSPRTHLKMPTSNPVTTLPIGRWEKAADKQVPKQITGLRFDEIPLADHPFTLFLPTFTPPSLLWGAAQSKEFICIGIQTYFDGRRTPPGAANEHTGPFHVFSPDILLRFIAKIAHGAAVAELGLDAFSPVLPDIILGKNPYISHVIGNSLIRRRIARQPGFQHTITLTLRLGYIVAVIFILNFPHPYVAVVGRARDDLTSLHTSALISSAIIA